MQHIIRNDPVILKEEVRHGWRFVGYVNDMRACPEVERKKGPQPCYGEGGCEGCGWWMIFEDTDPEKPAPLPSPTFPHLFNLCGKCGGMVQTALSESGLCFNCERLPNKTLCSVCGSPVTDNGVCLECERKSNTPLLLCCHTCGGDHHSVDCPQKGSGHNSGTSP